ncbi:hypothetical protein TNCV_3266511 [Trichonephila clavipes]|nr:hypothetical protein TNCV_3266511 [Trichonephila clavipes]
MSRSMPRSSAYCPAAARPIAMINKCLAQYSQEEEKVKNGSENADDKLTENYEDGEFEVPIEGQMVSYINIQQNPDVISREMDTKCFKNCAPFAQRNIITEISEQISAFSFETTLIQGTKHTFYDDNGEKFLIDNAQFEEELENCSIYLIQNESINFKPISANAPTDDSIHEHYIIPNAEFQAEEEEVIDTFDSTSGSLSNTSNTELRYNSSLASLSNNPKLEMGYYNEDFDFKATPTNISLENSTQENVSETAVDSSRKKNVFKKMKLFLKKVVTNKRNAFPYKRF